MTKFLNDAVLDAALDEVETNANIVTVCSEPPTTRTEAVTTYALADVTVDSSDYTKADGDVSGRKLTCAQQADVPIDSSGMATHVAHCDGTRLLAVTELTIGTTGRQDTPQGGTATTIQLDTGASAVDDEYNDMAVTLIRAGGSRETRIISDYVGATKTATVPAWTGASPTASDTFKVYGMPLTSGNNVTIPAHDIEISDAT